MCLAMPVDRDLTERRIFCLCLGTAVLVGSTLLEAFEHRSVASRCLQPLAADADLLLLCSRIVERGKVLALAALHVSLQGDQIQTCNCRAGGKLAGRTSVAKTLLRSVELGVALGLPSKLASELLFGQLLGLLAQGPQRLELE